MFFLVRASWEQVPSSKLHVTSYTLQVPSLEQLTCRLVTPLADSQKPTAITTPTAAESLYLFRLNWSASWPFLPRATRGV